MCRRGEPDNRLQSGYNSAVQITLQEYRSEDFELLWKIDQECFAPGIAYSRRELEAYIRRRRAFTLVARHIRSGDKTATGETASNDPFRGIVGFIVAETSRHGIGHIISIDVLPDNRRFGIGSRLLLAAENKLRAALCRFAVLETAVDNVAALAFYKRHQYSVVKVVPRYYSNRIDAFMLEKSLLDDKAGGAAE